MGKVYFGVPPELTRRLRDKHGIRYFIETGTYKAGTATWAAGEFEHVWTIEGWPDYYTRAVNAHGGNNKLSFIFGDSRLKLAEALAQVSEPAMVWLDAHWMGNTLVSAGIDECPIKEEIQALNNTGIQHYILIDDARCFTGDLPRGADPKLWPSIADIKSWLPDYYIVVHEDVIICVPPAARQVVDDYVRFPTVAILVLTSNNYVHMLRGFAHQFNRHWSPNQQVTALRYDRRPPQLPPNFYAPAAGYQDKLTFSAGLRNWIELSYPAEFVLLMLEDYWLNEKVDAGRVHDLIKFMRATPGIVKIDLSGDRAKFPHTDYDRDLIRSADDAPYQFSLQAAIWQRDFLLRFIDPTENPWQFEKNGTARIIQARKQGEFDGVILGTRTPVLRYVNACGGEGNKPGELDYSKIPAAMLRELQAARMI